MSLEVKDLNSGYKNMVVLKDINIQVKESELVAVLGPNGAGKTTLLRSIINLDIINIFKGEVVYNGHHIQNTPPSRIVKDIAFMPADVNVFPSLSVRENLEMATSQPTTDLGSKLEEIFDLFPRIKERQNQKAGTLSGGERQMLAMGCTLVPDLSFLLYDEPSGGLQPNLVDMLFERIKKIHESGNTILLVEQNAEKALELSDRGYVIEGGEIEASRPADDMLQDEEIAAHYLGM